MAQPVESLKTYFIIFFALLALTFMTVAAAYIDFGLLSTPIALMIALVKAFLVLWFFMHVRHGDGLLKVFAFVGILWVIHMVGATLSDYLSRPWESFPAQHTWVVESRSHLESRADSLF